MRKKVVGLSYARHSLFSLHDKAKKIKIKIKRLWNKMSNRFKRSEKLKAGRYMPPLYHKLPNEEYDVRKSEAVKWLLKNPSILEYVWDKFKQSNDVVFDPSTGKWQGVDWEGDER